MSKPHINVTPLIDVLLVLLIIFMVISPLKPSAFKARIPQEPDHDPRVEPPPLALVVVLNSDSSLKLNNENDLGTVENPEKITDRLSAVFRERKEKGVVSEHSDGTSEDQIERTVFIKAPHKIGYGNVAKVIDAVKLSGAYPISLQIDDLD